MYLAARVNRSYWCPPYPHIAARAAYSTATIWIYDHGSYIRCKNITLHVVPNIHNEQFITFYELLTSHGRYLMHIGAALGVLSDLSHIAFYTCLVSILILYLIYPWASISTSLKIQISSAWMNTRKKKPSVATQRIPKLLHQMYFIV